MLIQKFLQFQLTDGLVALIILSQAGSIEKNNLLNSNIFGSVFIIIQQRLLVKRFTLSVVQLQILKSGLLYIVTINGAIMEPFQLVDMFIVR